MNYKTGYCFTAIELFENFNLSKIKTKRKFWEGECHSNTKSELAGKILVYCFYLIVLDIIENNITFVLPTFNKDCFIYVKQFSDVHFRRMYNAGKFKEIDYVLSNFKGYQLYYRYETTNGFREKPIYINSKLKNKLTEHVNNGKQYY